MAFNVAQGFKDIANKFKNGLPIKNGGTGATTREQAWSNLSNNANSFISIYGTSDAGYENMGTGNYFIPIKETTATSFTNVARGCLKAATQKVTWNNVSTTSHGVLVDSNAAAGYYLVTGSVRYLNNTSTKYTLQTAAVRKRGTNYTNISWIAGDYGNERITHSFSQIIYLEPGDFVFLGGYKSSAFDAQLSIGISTRFAVIRLL